MAGTVEEGSRFGPAQFGLVAEGEQRFVAARIAPGAGDREHLVLGQER